MRQVLEAIKTAEGMEKPALTELFSDVYEQMPPNLHEQERSIRDAINKYPKDYPTDFHV
uniref:Branched chain alpha-keto acid dehydrogenase E1-alpha subunit n=1 Tax=Solanum tuberosum TaxID=4113 RepID=M1AZW8_SOLTU